MTETDQIDLTAGEPFEFAPGANHIMLTDLTTPLKTGTTFTLTLELASGRTPTVEVVVADNHHPEPETHTSPAAVRAPNTLRAGRAAPGRCLAERAAGTDDRRLNVWLPLLATRQLRSHRCRASVDESRETSATPGGPKHAK